MGMCVCVCVDASVWMCVLRVIVLGWLKEMPRSLGPILTHPPDDQNTKGRELENIFFLLCHSIGARQGLWSNPDRGNWWVHGPSTSTGE